MIGLHAVGLFKIGVCEWLYLGFMYSIWIGMLITIGIYIYWIELIPNMLGIFYFDIGIYFGILQW